MRTLTLISSNSVFTLTSPRFSLFFHIVFGDPRYSVLLGLSVVSRSLIEPSHVCSLQRLTSQILHFEHKFDQI